MEQTSRFKISLEKLKQASLRLKESLDIPKDDIVRDSVIQRFEFTFELLWKTLKLYLEREGFDEKTPREVLKKSYEIEMIEDIELFLSLMQMRNLSSHSYNEHLAEDIYKLVSSSYKDIASLVDLLLEK